MIGTYVNLPEYEDACAVLFGPDFLAVGRHLVVPDPSHIKSVFRQRAFETHPDRSILTGEPISVMEARFKKISHAYEILLKFAHQSMQPGFPRKDFMRSCQGMRNGRQGSGEREWKPSPAARFYTGRMPGRKLFLGQFLYYSGIITRHTHACAVCWQKMSRPMVGRLAGQWKMLSRHDIYDILLGREPGERFCEAGLRLGYLTEHQTAALLARQQVLQPRIGEYFIANGILDHTELRTIVRAFHLHNMRHKG